MNYELYSVANHKGSLGMGHYTAQCVDPMDENVWDMYNDSTSYPDSKLQYKEAYLLYYKQRANGNGECKANVETDRN